MITGKIAAIIQEPYVAQGFGEESYHNVTTLFPVGLAILLIASIFTLVLPRRSAILPMVVIQTLVPASQRIVIFSLDFHFARVLVLIGLARVLLNGENRWLRPVKLDKLVLTWCLATVAIYSVQHGHVGAFIYKLGWTVDTLGIYCLARLWIRSRADIDRIAGAFLVLGALAAAMFLYEWTTQTNVYSWVGGVSPYTMIRDGKLRCVGPFKHPILAGTFWAGVLPWAMGRWWTQPQQRVRTFLGISGIVLVIFSTASSTPLIGLLVGLGSCAAFSLRNSMGAIRWGVVIALASLHLVMEKPVWHLISRVSVVSGSTGYHRYRLINAAVEHWRDWFLLGTDSTAGWGYYLFDVTNQFVKEAIDAGIIGLGLFVAYIWVAFSYLGRLWRADRRRRGGAYRYWTLGCAIFAQCVMFLGISVNHAPQNLFIWLVPIGASAGLYQTLRFSQPGPGARLGSVEDLVLPPEPDPSSTP